MDHIKHFFKLIRPHHWIKNLFVFIPVFFAGELFNPDKFQSLMMAFVAFCLGASSVYVLNDIRDVESDRMHPEKSKRPIASGAIKINTAIVYFILLIVSGIFIAIQLPSAFIYLFCAYIGLNILYSMGMKRISILDLIFVSVGFVLRTLSGGIAADVTVSHWLVIMIFLLSMFLVISKRMEDLNEYISTGKILRKSIVKYNRSFIESALTLLSAIIILSYILYTITPEINAQYETDYLYLTSLFVIVGILRYLQIILVGERSGSPVRILYEDRFIIINLVLWVLTYFVIIYVFEI